LGIKDIWGNVNVGLVDQLKTGISNRKIGAESYSSFFVLCPVFFSSVDTAESSKMELMEKTLLETSEVW